MYSPQDFLKNFGQGTKKAKLYAEKTVEYLQKGKEIFIFFHFYSFH
jgi:hypothetical protein